MWVFEINGSERERVYESNFANAEDCLKHRNSVTNAYYEQTGATGKWFKR